MRDLDDVFLFRQLVRDAAVAVEGTEAVGFRIDATSHELRVVVHLRPDDAPPEKRAAAVEAFRRLVGPSVIDGQDAALALAGTAPPGEPPQFCLVRMLGDQTGPKAAVAVISRCVDAEDAESRLDVLRRQL